MFSKIILLIGGILASLVVFLCIKNETKEIKHQKIVINPVIKPIIKKTVLEEPNFNYTYNNQNINGLFSITQQLYIDKKIESCCKNIECNKHITYKGHVKDAIWKKLSLDSMMFFTEHQIQDSKITANGNDIKIEGTLNSEEQYLKMDAIINDYNNTNINITNNVTFIPLAPKPPSLTKELQEDINKILEENPIFFELNSDILTSESKTTLLKIIKYLNKLDTNSIILIGGHTDSRGKKSYNLALSEKRAKRVKSFIEDNNIEDLLLINAKGFGSSEPKMEDSKNSKNRRVEIIIQKANND